MINLAEMHLSLFSCSLCSQSGLQYAVPKSTWLQHLGNKFHEVLQVNAKSMQGVPQSMPFTIDGYGGGSAAVLDVCTFFIFI